VLLFTWLFVMRCVWKPTTSTEVHKVTRRVLIIRDMIAERFEAGRLSNNIVETDIEARIRKELRTADVDQVTSVFVPDTPETPLDALIIAANISHS